jgi:hypothetical protein
MILFLPGPQIGNETNLAVFLIALLLFSLSRYSKEIYAKIPFE